MLPSTELTTRLPAPLLPDASVCGAPLSLVAVKAWPSSRCSASALAKVVIGTRATVRDWPLSKFTTTSPFDLVSTPLKLPGATPFCVMDLGV